MTVSAGARLRSCPHRKACAVRPSDLADHLIVEVLNDVEVVKDRLDMRALFLEGFLEVGVHVTGNRLDIVHPFQTDMLDEVIHDLLFLAVRDPEDMPGKHVDDVSGIAVSVMRLELINAEETRRLLRFYQCLTINGVFILKLQIDRLYCILAKSGDLELLPAYKSL